ncbi:hypothetical protein HZC07_02005 [Candidatus Micrarchaeota archaeon]|nr:hypothetical protein [Candidatus Micrarchaeota archaeon]
MALRLVGGPGTLRKAVPEMRFHFGFPADRAILLEPSFSDAYSEICKLSQAKGLNAGTYLIHRTNDSCCPGILENGLHVE